MHTCDLIVIGGGPGGYVAAIRGAQAGLKVACVERRTHGHLGGTCLNVGCVPTKALLESAKQWYKLQHLESQGFSAKGLSYNWQHILETKDRIVGEQRRGLQYLMKRYGVTVIHGHGSLLTAAASGQHRVKVVKGGESSGEEVLAAHHVILATGSRVRDLKGWDTSTSHPSLLTSDTILSLPEPPQSLAIIGGGVIGMEFASLFAMMGTQVQVFEAAPKILQGVDDDCVQEFRRFFVSRNSRDDRSFRMHIHTDSRLSLDKIGKKGVTCTIQGPSLDVLSPLRKRSGPAREPTLTCDKVLVAVGRDPVSDGLDLNMVGIARDQDGYIEVNDHCETGCAGIYAIGDLIRTPALAHTASAEAEYVVSHLLGRKPQPLSYRYHPLAVYTYPELAAMGDHEASLKDQGRGYKVTKFPFSILAKGKIEAADMGFTKILSDPHTTEILGVHMVGARVTEMISDWTSASLLENTLHEVASVVRPHPTLSEAITEAAHAALGHALHI